MSTIIPTFQQLRQFERKDRSNVFAVVEALLFIVVVLMLLAGLAAGVASYKHISDTRMADERLGVASNVIANGVRYADTANTVAVGEGPEGPALVLADGAIGTGYETRLYQYQGKLVEEYAKAGAAYTPERATQLMDNKRFQFSYDKGLLTVITDAGETTVALHSALGAV